LLALLSAGGRARVAVTDLADLSYRSEPPAAATDEADAAGTQPRSREP
jgi:hypothetical protein